MLVQLGIMQGRFSKKDGFFPQRFPWNDWEKEFEVCEQAGLQCIEWMFNYEGSEINPVVTTTGQEIIAHLAKTTGVKVRSVCANYFMETGLYDFETLQVAKSLVLHMEKAAIEQLIVPVFNKCKPKNAEEYELLKKQVGQLADFAEQHNVRVGIEEEWEIGQVLDFLQTSELLGVCYDLGNAAGLGKNSVDEINCLGDRIIDVHLKDKRLGGSSVMLGEGEVDFSNCFKVLEEVSYKGPYIFESYFGKETISDTLLNIQYIRNVLEVIHNEGA